MAQPIVENSEKRHDVVLAHDSFTQYGGAERIFAGFAKMFPQAPVFTLVSDPNIEQRFHLQKAQVSWLQKLYNIFPKFQWLFPLIPLVTATTKLPKSKVLLSSSSAYLKALKKPRSTVHINYCHTPTRFLWTDYNYALNEIPLLLKPLAKAYLGWLKRWDKRAAKKVDIFIANSKEVQKRIKKYYDRDSKIIYPFIDTKFWHNTAEKQDYFLIAGRLAPYKNHDKVIMIFNQLGIRLHVVGEGRYQKYLQSIAKPNIKFLGRVTDEELRDQYSGAKGFIYPQIEDFGLMPIEAASCGTPTIARAIGGSLETVIPGQTGELLEEIDEHILKTIIENWDQSKYDRRVMREHAEKFSQENFEIHIKSLLNKFIDL